MAYQANLDAMQSEVFRSVQPGSVIVLAMGRGTGKTFLDRTIIHTLAYKTPGIEIGLLLPSLKQAKMVFWPHLLSDFTGTLKGRVKTNMSDLTAVYENGSRLSTWGAENAHAIRGQRFGAVVEDECDDIDPATETAVVQPTFSRSGRNAIWVKSGTPRRGRHGILFRDFELGRKRHESEGLRYRSFRFRSDQSPQVDQAWLRSVKAITNPAVYSREYDCDFDSGEGLVYPFDEDFHIQEPPPLGAFREFVVGVDHGWADPGVMLLVGIQGHGQDATAWVLAEHYETECPNGTWDQRARDWQFAKEFHCDPSRPDRITELRKAGANAIKADNNHLGGISRVADMLFKRSPTSEGGVDWSRLYVSRHCTNTIREFTTYRRKRDPQRPDGFLEEPEGRNDHAMDALRYALVGRFGRGDTSRHVASGR